MANEVNIKVKADSKNALRSMNRLSSSGKKLGSTMATAGKQMAIGVAGIAAITGAAGLAASKLFSMAGELDLIENKVSTVFGEQRGVVTEWAKEVSAEMGLTVSATENLAAKFGDLLVPMGFTREAAASMSTSVVGLSGALAEWSSGQVNATQAADILAKAMLGEREGLKTLGISIMEADVQARLMAQGQEELEGKMLQQAKAMITQALIFEKSQDAQAAFAKGGDTLARTQAKLKAATGELKESIVKALMPSFANLAVMLNDKVIPIIINELIPFLNRKIPEAIEFLTPHIRDIAVGFQETFKTASTLIKWFADFWDSQGTIIKAIIATIGVAILAAFGPVAAPIVAITALMLLIGRFKDKWREIANGVIGSVESMANGILSGLGSALRTVDNFINNILDGLRKINIMGIKPFEGLGRVNFASIANREIKLGRFADTFRNESDLWDDMTTEANDAAFVASGVQPEIGSGSSTIPFVPSITALPSATAKEAVNKATNDEARMHKLLEWSKERMESIKVQEENIRRSRLSAVASVLSGNITEPLLAFGAGGSMADPNISDALLDLSRFQSIADSIKSGQTTEGMLLFGQGGKYEDASLFGKLKELSEDPTDAAKDAILEGIDDAVRSRIATGVREAPIVVNVYAGVMGDPAEAGQMILDKINQAKMAGASTAFLTES